MWPEALYALAALAGLLIFAVWRSATWQRRQIALGRGQVRADLYDARDRRVRSGAWSDAKERPRV